MYNIPGRKVLAWVLVERLVELAQHFLKDGPHRGVVDPVRVHVHIFEALEHLEEQPCLVELADRVVEIEPLQHLAHVRAEAGNIVSEIRREMRRVCEELLEVVPGRVVEGEPRDLPKLRVKVLELLASQLCLLTENLLLGIGQHAVQTPQDRERKDHVLVLAALEGVADQVRNTPKKADDLAMIHRLCSPSSPMMATLSM